MMTYKGYVGIAELDADAGVLHGRVAGLRDVVTFEATSVDELRRAFEESVDDYLAYCAQRGEDPDKPCSGTLSLRLPPELHREAALRAEMTGTSLNQWIVDLVAQHTSKAAAANQHAFGKRARRASRSAGAARRR